MGIAIKLSGGVTLVGVLCIVGSIVLDYGEKVQDKYWKLFWAGAAITVIGIFLVIITARSGNSSQY